MWDNTTFSSYLGYFINFIGGIVKQTSWNSSRTSFRNVSEFMHENQFLVKEKYLFAQESKSLVSPGEKELDPYSTAN